MTARAARLSICTLQVALISAVNDRHTQEVSVYIHMDAWKNCSRTKKWTSSCAQRRMTYTKKSFCVRWKRGRMLCAKKPAALNSAQLQQMMDKAVQTGKFLTVHQNRRWDEDFLAVKNLYDHGWMGTPFRIESRVHGSRGITGRLEAEAGSGAAGWCWIGVYICWIRH